MPNTRYISIKKLRDVFSEILSKELTTYAERIQANNGYPRIRREMIDWLNSLSINDLGEITQFKNSSLIHNLFLFFNKTYSNLLPEFNIKSLPVVANTSLFKVLEESKDTVIKRLSKNTDLIKRTYFNKDNSNVLLLDPTTRKIFHLTFNNLFNTLFSKGFVPAVDTLVDILKMKRPEITEDEVLEYIRKNFEQLHIVTANTGINRKKYYFKLYLNGEVVSSTEFSIKLEETSFTKAITRLFDRVTGSQADEFNRRIQTYFEVLNKRFDKFVRLQGDLISHYYHVNRYTTISRDNLHKSCMRSSSSPSFYSIFPNQIQMLSLFDDIGKLKGRALLWNAYKLPDQYKDIESINDYKEILVDENKVLIVDRVYYDSPDTYNLFAAYCRTKGIKTIYSQQGIEREHPNKLIIPIDTLSVQKIEELFLKNKIFRSDDNVFKDLINNSRYVSNNVHILREDIDFSLRPEERRRRGYLMDIIGSPILYSDINEPEVKKNKHYFDNLFQNISWPYLDSFGSITKIHIGGIPTLAFTASSSRVYSDFTRVFTNFYSEKYPNYKNSYSNQNICRMNVSTIISKFWYDSVQKSNTLPILIDGIRTDLNILTPTAEYSKEEKRRKLEIKKLIHSFVVQAKITFNKQLGQDLFVYNDTFISRNLKFAEMLESSTVTMKTSAYISATFKEIVGRDITIKEITLIYGLFLLGALKHNYLLDFKNIGIRITENTVTSLINNIFYRNTGPEIIFPEYVVHYNNSKEKILERNFSVSQQNVKELISGNDMADYFNISSNMFEYIEVKTPFILHDIKRSTIRNNLNLKITAYNYKEDSITVRTLAYLNIYNQDIIVYNVAREIPRLTFKAQGEYLFPNNCSISGSRDITSVVEHIINNYFKNISTEAVNNCINTVNTAIRGSRNSMYSVVSYIFRMLDTEIEARNNGEKVKDFNELYNDIELHNVLIPCLSSNNASNPITEVVHIKDEISNILNLFDCFFIKKEDQQIQNT